MSGESTDEGHPWSPDRSYAESLRELKMYKTLTGNSNVDSATWILKNAADPLGVKEKDTSKIGAWSFSVEVPYLPCLSIGKQ